MDFALGLLAILTISTGFLFSYNAMRGIREDRKGRMKSTLAADAPNTRAEMMAAE